MGSYYTTVSRRKKIDARAALLIAEEMTLQEMRKADEVSTIYRVDTRIQNCGTGFRTEATIRPGHWIHTCGTASRDTAREQGDAY